MRIMTTFVQVKSNASSNAIVCPNRIVYRCSTSHTSINMSFLHQLRLEAEDLSNTETIMRCNKAAVISKGEMTGSLGGICIVVQVSHNVM